MLNTLFKQLRIRQIHGIKGFTRQAEYKFSKKKPQQEYRFENDTYILEDANTGFKPQEKLKFIDGFTPLYKYTFYKTGRGTMIFLMGVTSAICLYSLKKLYHLQDRSMFGIFAYSMILIYAARKLPKFYRILHCMAIQIDLKEGGRMVRVTLPKWVMFLGHKEYDIQKVSHTLNMGGPLTSLFPVNFEDDILFISKDGQLFQKEILQEIFKSQYINTEENDSV